MTSVFELSQLHTAERKERGAQVIAMPNGSSKLVEILPIVFSFLLKRRAQIAF